MRSWRASRRAKSGATKLLHAALWSLACGAVAQGEEATRLVCRAGGGMLGQLDPDGSVTIKFRHGTLASLAAQLPAGRCARLGKPLAAAEPAVLSFAGDTALRARIMESVVGAKTFIVEVRDNGQGAFEITALVQ